MTDDHVPDGPWSGDAGAALVRAVVDRVSTGGALDDLGLGSIEGRVDLRGLPGSGRPGGPVEEIVVLQSVSLQSVDLRGAWLPSWKLFDCTLHDCRFDGAACWDWRLWSTRVSECSFVGADLSGSAVGTWRDGRGNSWTGVDLSGSDFRVSTNWAARYEDCEFADADLTGARFEQCTLRRCHFAGDLREVVFDGRGVDDRPPSPPLDDVDFRDARFHDVEILGFDLANVSLPDNPP